MLCRQGIDPSRKKGKIEQRANIRHALQEVLPAWRISLKAELRKFSRRQLVEAFVSHAGVGKGKKEGAGVKSSVVIT